jgi:hypothetical protein
MPCNPDRAWEFGPFSGENIGQDANDLTVIAVIGALLRNHVLLLVALW